jgi:hypothetical protein
MADRPLLVGRQAIIGIQLGGKGQSLREYFDPARAAKALDTPIPWLCPNAMRVPLGRIPLGSGLRHTPLPTHPRTHTSPLVSGRFNSAAATQE